MVGFPWRQQVLSHELNKKGETTTTNFLDVKSGHTRFISISSQIISKRSSSSNTHIQLIYHCLKPTKLQWPKGHPTPSPILGATRSHGSSNTTRIPLESIFGLRRNQRCTLIITSNSSKKAGRGQDGFISRIQISIRIIIRWFDMTTTILSSIILWADSEERDHIQPTWLVKWLSLNRLQGLKDVTKPWLE